MMEQLKVPGANMDLPLSMSTNAHIQFSTAFPFFFFFKFDKEIHLPFIYITVLF